MHSSASRSQRKCSLTGGVRSSSLPGIFSPAARIRIRANILKPASGAVCKRCAAFTRIRLNSKPAATAWTPSLRRPPMSSVATRPAAPDQPQRESALDSARSILVQAPAGSGKTDLLARRFLRLLAEVDSPGQIVAITFTKAAAAEMRNRILAELEKAPTDTEASNGLELRMSKDNDVIATSAATASNDDGTGDEFSMRALARNALAHSRALGWNLIELPAQLRISTIDSFCRELALQQPLLSGLGGGLEI